MTMMTGNNCTKCGRREAGSMDEEFMNLGPMGPLGIFCECPPGPSCITCKGTGNGAAEGGLCPTCHGRGYMRHSQNA